MKNKNGVLICQRVWKTVKSQEKSGNFEVDDKWQPWEVVYTLGAHYCDTQTIFSECAVLLRY